MRESQSKAYIIIISGFGVTTVYPSFKTLPNVFCVTLSYTNTPHFSVSKIPFCTPAFMHFMYLFNYRLDPPTNCKELSCPAAGVVSLAASQPLPPDTDMEEQEEQVRGWIIFNSF